MIQDHPLFVYGTLMSDQRAFHLLAPAVKRSVRAALADADLHVVSWYPLAVPGRGTVLGEAHWLYADGYADVLARLDAYEGDEYVRRIRPIRLATGGQIRAWVYLGDPTAVHALPRLEHGDWRAYHGE